jgi:hypothetical protein
MGKKRPRQPLDEFGQAKLLERIEERFAQLEQGLDELERQLPENVPAESQEETPPRKPR